MKFLRKEKLNVSVGDDNETNHDFLFSLNGLVEETTYKDGWTIYKLDSGSFKIRVVGDYLECYLDSALKNTWVNYEYSGWTKGKEIETEIADDLEITVGDNDWVNIKYKLSNGIILEIDRDILHVSEDDAKEYDISMKDGYNMGSLLVFRNK